MTAILTLLGLIAVLISLLGTIYPAIPGLGLMFDGAWLLAYAGNYRVYGTNTLIFIGITTAFNMAIGYVSGVLRVKYIGASKRTLWGAFIGGATSTLLSLPGLLLGPLVDAGIGEFTAKRNVLQAGKVSLGTFIDFIIGMVAKVGCTLAIVLTLLSVWIFNLFT